MDKAQSYLNRLVVRETVVTYEGAPRLEAEREADPGTKKLAAAATSLPRSDDDIRSTLPVSVVRRHDLVIADFGEHARKHRLGRSVIRIDVAERSTDPLNGIGDPVPALGVRKRVTLHVEAAAGPNERQLVRKVAIDGYPTDPSALSDLAHGRCRRAYGLVELDRRLDDALTSFVLTLGSVLESVLAGHIVMIHAVSRNLTTGLSRPYTRWRNRGT